MAKLGDYGIAREFFPCIEERLASLSQPCFQEKPEQHKSRRVSELLLELIREAPAGKFLLIPILHYIEEIEKRKVVEHYTFSHFEFWLNHFSGLSFEENLSVRGKIAGKVIPREEYQLLFPLGIGFGKGKLYSGSHVVTAHSSPDLDTTVASFWGWMDAFAARVSEGLHEWNVPGGEPLSQVEIGFLFHKVFGERVFAKVAKTKSALSVSSLDLVTQKGMVKKRSEELTLGIKLEEGGVAVVLVDEEGYYLGEWRHVDAEPVRFVINLLNQCLRWFANHVHLGLISFFKRERVRREEWAPFLKDLFGMPLSSCEPAKEFDEKQIELFQTLLKKVVGLEGGMASSFTQLAQVLEEKSLSGLHDLIQQLEGIEQHAIFDGEGKLKEGRPQLFTFLGAIFEGIDSSIRLIRSYVERLDIAQSVKREVLGIPAQPVSSKSDIEEIKSKIGNYPFLTVTSSDPDGRLFPVGVIHATDVYKSTLGTVTLRDFCNREETKVPQYLDIISVVDHHKSTLITTSPIVAHISDAQSSNSLVANLSFQLNDRYSSGGMTRAAVEAQIEEVRRELQASPKERGSRILGRLLQRRMALQEGGKYFVSSEREFTEYLHFLYAILDDTDLLTKVSPCDVECVMSLLNRLKSLSVGKEVEVVDFDDLSRGEGFAKLAVARLLQNDEMHSLYRKIYVAKEEMVERSIADYAEGKSSPLFADTKEQNGCCRVGQLKMFSKNWPAYDKDTHELRKRWIAKAEEIYRSKKEVDFHLQMISTLAGSDELYAGEEKIGGGKAHFDELWFWVPEGRPEHLRIFLNNFRSSPVVASLTMEVEFLGENAEELEQIFAESFLPTKRSLISLGLPIAVLKYTPGAINSRKAMISPYLPSV